jgi:hypothetical protein
MVTGIVEKFVALPYFLGKEVVEHQRCEKYDEFIRPSAECVPWDFSAKGRCTCEQICPLDFSILGNRSKWELAGTQDGSLDEAFFPAFNNEKDEFINVRPRTVGYCFGFATLTRKFKYLAVFKDGPRQTLEAFAW